MADPIYPILKAHWKEFADANSYQWAEYGIAFNPAPRTLFFRTHHRVGKPAHRPISTGYDGCEVGVFQVDVMSPEKDREQASRDLGWAVRDHFKNRWLGSGAVKVRIERMPQVHETYPEDGYLKTVVDIEWFSELLAG